jgi:polar amino acid transport system ATP-binding protein
LLDEVTSALDPVLVNEVLSSVRDLKLDGMTMVLATHEMGFATQVADEVCFLESGSIIERGTPEQVLRNPVNPKTQEFLKRVHQLGVCRFDIYPQGYGSFPLYLQQRSLQDVFTSNL